MDAWRRSTFIAYPAALFAVLAACGGSEHDVDDTPAGATRSALVSNFAYWAQQSGVTALSGDFDGDGRADVALTGGPGWYTLPVAFSNGNGTFNVTNYWIADFSAWAQQPGAKPVAGDVNGDGRADVAMTGGVGWYTLPVAFSNANGTFRVTNYWIY